jgi:hypothetical protein
VGSYPQGFVPQEYVRLWDHLAAWLAERHNRQLVRPEEGARRRYLAYPMAHVPLRQVDIDRLPRFFDAYGYQPQSRVPLSRLAFDLHDRAGPWPHFTEAGRTAVADLERRPLVVKQVAFELEHWDGGREHANGRRSAPIEVWMDIRQRRARLYLLARRPTGFPETISYGDDYTFQSHQEGWYDPLHLNANDTRVLAEGLSVGSAAELGFVLKLRPVDVMPLAPSEEFSGFVASPTLRLNTNCAVLCPEASAPTIASHLEQLCDQAPVRRRDDTLPVGWCLFVNVRAARSLDPPPGLDVLAVETDVGLAVRSGLRVGRRWTWLEGAAPRLQLIGLARNTPVLVDGAPATPDDEGFLPPDLFASLGDHTVEAGNQIRRRISIVRGTISPDCADWLADDSTCSANAVLLPGGAWTLVGAAEGEYARVSTPASGGVAAPPFLPIWAIGSGSARSPLVLHLHPLLQPQSRQRRAAATHLQHSVHARRMWAETAYQAHIRRPHTACPAGCPSEQLLLEWRRHFNIVRAFKRRLKARR